MKQVEFEKLIRLLEELQKGQQLDVRGSRGYSVGQPHMRKQHKPGYGKMNKYEEDKPNEIKEKEPVEVSRAFSKKAQDDE